MDVKQKVARLSQLRRLQKEVDLLSQRMGELELAAEGGTGHVTGLPGRPPKGCTAQYRRLWLKLDDRRLRCMQLMGALYTFICDIDDSLMRQIMTYRYIDGMTWKGVAAAIGETDEQYPRRLHNHFLAITPLPRGAERALDEPLEGRNEG